MPHQCLKCGHCFAEGSSEILKGCSDCGGTRFFYTQEPLAHEEREKLYARSNKDLRSLIEEAAKAQGSGKAPARKGDWVALGPGYLRNLVNEVVKERPSEGGPTVRDYVTGMGGTADPVEGPHAAGQDPASARHLRPDLGIDFIGAEGQPRSWAASERPPRPWPASGTRQAVEGRAAPASPSPRTHPAASPRTTPKPAADSGGGALPATTPRKKPADVAPPPSREETVAEEGTPTVDVPPEVLRIHGEGSYEIDVKGLLEDHPIIVNKDGSYLIHLPSVFEGVERAKRWKK